MLFGVISFNHNDTRVIFLIFRYEGPCMVYKSRWYQEQQYRQVFVLYWYPKMRNPRYRYSNGVEGR